MEEYRNSIIELNKEIEPFVIQGTATRPIAFKEKFENKYIPLQFVHFSDIHTKMDLWNRIVEYINYYSNYISFGIHTGDMCGNNQELYADFYNYGEECKHPIYNCVGNHDTVVGRKKRVKATKEATHKLLFAPQPDTTQDVVFMECDYPMNYYKDIKESNIRMIVLDYYYDIEQQKEWLVEVLDEAKEKGISVITAMHIPTAEIKESFDVTFNTFNDYSTIDGSETTVLEPIIADFIAKGGEHICHLAGHHHYDMFGVTENGILNVCVPAATNWDGWSDGKRIKGTKTYDCFNVVSVDVNLGLLKLCRVGNNCDHYFREQNVLCFDYKNRKVIYNR